MQLVRHMLLADGISLDDHALMALPELYEHSRKGEYFGLKLFGIYMFDGLVQVRIHHVAYHVQLLNLSSRSSSSS